MSVRNKDHRLIVGLLAVHTMAMLAVAGLVLGWWSSGSAGGAPPQGVLVPVSEPRTGPGIDGPTVTSEGSLMTATATPAGALAAPTEPPAATAPPPPPTATATAERPTVTPVRPTNDAANFAGRWRIVDVVTEGVGTGEAFSFDVALAQDGDRLTGGNSGILLDGVVNGDTATLQYSQPALGFTGTFVWTVVAPGRAEGTFTSTAPNSGTSTAQRLQ